MEDENAHGSMTTDEDENGWTPVATDKENDNVSTGFEDVKILTTITDSY